MLNMTASGTGYFCFPAHWSRLLPDRLACKLLMLTMIFEIIERFIDRVATSYIPGFPE
jgi:hypothetical protein